MVTRQETSAPRAPQVGDIWKDVSCGYERFVRVDAVDTRTLQIKSVQPVEVRKGRRWVTTRKACRRWTKLERFTRADPDFVFVESGS